MGSESKKKPRKATTRANPRPAAVVRDKARTRLRREFAVMRGSLAGESPEALANQFSVRIELANAIGEAIRAGIPPDMSASTLLEQLPWRAGAFDADDAALALAYESCLHRLERDVCRWLDPMLSIKPWFHPGGALLDHASALVAVLGNTLPHRLWNALVVSKDGALSQKDCVEVVAKHFDLDERFPGRITFAPRVRETKEIWVCMSAANERSAIRGQQMLCVATLATIRVLAQILPKSRAVSHWRYTSIAGDDSKAAPKVTF